METVKIGVLISDSDYRNALLRGLSHESRDFQFAALTGTLCDENLRECQIILTDGTDIEDAESKHEDPGSTLVSDIGINAYGTGNRGQRRSSVSAAVITLTHHELYDMGYCSDKMEIFRYEDARVFVNKIIYYYAKAKGIDLYFHGKRKCRKVVFSSLRGGSGTTSAAMTTARFLKFRFDKKTLFISLCPIDGSRDYTGASDGGNMLSLLYHLNTGKDVPLCKFISSQEGVDHIRGQRDNRAAAEMTVTEMKQLLRMIDRMGEYDYVIFDVSSHLSSLARFLMDRADVNVVISQNDAEVSADDTVEHHLTGNVINVMALRSDHGENRSGSLTLSYDPDAFVPDDKRTHIDIRGQYGKDICILAERIVGNAE